MIVKCLIAGLSLSALVPFASADSRVVSSVVRTDPHTGRLVRKTLVSQSQSQSQDVVSRNAAAPQKLNDLINSIALENEVEAPLVHSVIQTESNYNPLAVSNKGAQGLMQLIPSTAKRFGVKNSFDMQENVEGGTKYLKYLIGLFHGDYARAVAAYNAGEAAVTKYGGVPPYKETQSYVAQVAKRLEVRRRAFIPATAAAPVAEAVTSETYSPVIASVSPDGRTYYRTP
jgi:soluble lytic murein transglycosylase-like protein